MKRSLHKLFTEALFVKARLGMTQIISVSGGGERGLNGDVTATGWRGLSCKKEREGSLYTATQWLIIKDILLSGKSEWKKMCTTCCYLSKKLHAYVLKIHKHQKGTVQIFAHITSVSAPSAPTSPKSMSRKSSPLTMRPQPVGRILLLKKNEELGAKIHSPQRRC